MPAISKAPNVNDPNWTPFELATGSVGTEWDRHYRQFRDAAAEVVHLLAAANINVSTDEYEAVARRIKKHAGRYDAVLCDPKFNLTPKGEYTVPKKLYKGLVADYGRVVEEVFEALGKVVESEQLDEKDKMKCEGAMSRARAHARAASDIYEEMEKTMEALGCFDYCDAPDA